MNKQTESTDIKNPLYDEVRDRFGVLPNFFRIAPEAPEITANLWGFAKFGYLDNPLPPLFKERLFVYLSRFCDIRYCIARHVGFLVGLGRPAGDHDCGTESPEQVVRLIRRPLPRGDELGPHLARLESCPPACLPDPETPDEEAVFACATHVFLQTPQAAECLDALGRKLDPVTFQRLLVLLTFVRTAHYWTKLHPELEYEEDIRELFVIHESLADCILRDPEADSCETTQVLLDELAALRRERAIWEEVERANRALKDSDRRKDEFLATLAHELRNPLAPIRTGLEAMKMVSNDPVMMGEIRSTMERQARQMASLIDDLLDVSRITQGKFELRKCRVALADVLQSAVEATRPLIDEAGLALTITTPPKSIVLEGDPNRLAQVFSNLLGNSAKYTPEGGHIWLSAERQEEHVLVSVRDTGLGIPPEMQNSVFEMFAQIDRPLEKGFKGLGLGLTIVKRLTEMHGGSVEVRSEGAGRGSEFIVRLRVVTEPLPDEGPTPAVRGAASPASRLRILVVDDNKAAADMMGMVVRILGNDVRTAYDGSQGVEAAEAFRPDVVLMDLGMPKLNGYEAARRIRQQSWGQDTLLVALTGWGQEEDRRRTKEAGFNHHLVKPVEPSELQKLLADWKN